VKRAVVIGGGFAGLASATALAARGAAVTVLEARPYLGGRARSFRDDATDAVVDNGQHVLMGCYTETLAFLERIAALSKLRRQRRPHVALREAGGRGGAIACPPLPGPLHMLAAVLRFQLLTPAERLRALSGGARLLFMRRRGDARLARLTVEQLLDLLAQPAAVRRALWHPIAIATLNEAPARAAAAPFAEVLARAFFGRRRDAQLVLPAVGLSELYTEDARRFLEAHGGTVEMRAQVASLELAPDRVAGVRLRDGRRLAADACIAAVPPGALAAIVPPALAPPPFETSPIVSVHLWYDRPVLRGDFVGLLGTRTQWLFDHSHAGSAGTGIHGLSAVLSADREAVAWERERIVAAVAADVRLTCPAAGEARLLRSVVVKERHATIATTPEAERRRPPVATAIDNLFLAGDWIATGLPPTIESATLAGHRAARATADRLELH